MNNKIGDIETTCLSSRVWLDEVKWANTLPIIYSIINKKSIEIIDQKGGLVEDRNFQVDFYIPELKEVCEVEGEQHFTAPEQIYADEFRNQKLGENGVKKIISLPYWFCFNQETLSKIFDYPFTKDEFKQITSTQNKDFLHFKLSGFCFSSTRKPGYFVEDGLSLMIKLLNKFPEQKKYVREALEFKKGLLKKSKKGQNFTPQQIFKAIYGNGKIGKKMYNLLYV
jgi:hypothetical protein